MARLLRSGDARALLLLAAWPFIYFWPVTLGQSVWFTTDVARLFYPFAVELSRALADGRLPLWSPGLLAGFPLLAEGQVGALYPVNLILLKLLPTHIALSYAIVLHLAWAGTGMYACARSMRLRPPGALLAGFVFSFSSFIFGHLSHPSVIATVSWLPWLVFFSNRFRATRGRNRSAGIWFLATTLAFGLQYLPGSAQMAFLNSIAFVLFGVLGEWLEGGPSIAHRLAAIGLGVGLPALLGAGLAAVQLLPTNELIGFSVRSGASEEFFASYSLPPNMLAHMVLPFLFGEPSEGTGEYWTFFGLAPLVLAVLAPLLRRDRQTLFLAVFGLGALSLALGGSNPIYPLLYRLPLFGLFRVPARYLDLVFFAAGLLAATALDELLKRPFKLAPVKWVWAAQAGLAVLVAGSMWLAATQSLEFWLAAWRILPVVMGLAILATMAGLASGRITGGLFATLIVGLTVLDLANYFPPFLATIDGLTPVSYVETTPRSLAALGAPQAPERVYTDESVFPSMPALRASLFPNVALSYNRSSAQAYTSLAYARHLAFDFDPSPAMFNLLNARWLMIPLEPRAETKRSTPRESLGLDVLDKETMIPATPAVAVRLASYTEDASGLPGGTVVGELVVRQSSGMIATFPIRYGVETADWDLDRKSDGGQPSPAKATIAHSFPGFWRSYGRGFEGHTYSFTVTLEAGSTVTGLLVRITNPQARLAIEDVSLLDANGKAVSLATLSGKNRFRLAYLSDTAAIWENLDVLPRAFVAQAAEVADDETSLARLRAPQFPVDRVVLLSQGQPMGEPVAVGAEHGVATITGYADDRVQVDVSTERDGYLVLGDSWYPGWQATVDGKPAEIVRADVIMRAVRVTAGRHTVVFEYRPMSFFVGSVVAALSMVAAAVIALVMGSVAGTKWARSHSQ